MRRPQPWVNSDITLSAFASRIRRAGRTVSPRRVVSTLPRTIKTTAIAFSGCSMTPSKAVIFGREKLHVLGEANFSDHGANRLGASALMQGLADGYFVIPSTIANYLATQMGKKVSTDQPEFKAVEDEVRTRINRLLAIKGKKTVSTFHRDLGLLVWDKCGMARDAQGLQEALQKIPALRAGFWENVQVLGEFGAKPCSTNRLRPRVSGARARRPSCGFFGIRRRRAQVFQRSRA
jgi:hypothetical protein